MALINNIYVTVKDETLSREAEITQHPVEKGLPLTSTVRSKPKAISISGVIVDTEQYDAGTIITKLEELYKSGSLIDYKGRNSGSNFQIKSFNTTHPNTIWGGAEFDMELVETRIAKSAYDPSKQKAAEKAKQASNPTLEIGSIVVFKGGSVYVSSDATQAAANRGRQTCKITNINTRSWAKHQYHLISTEKQYPNNVYGWVDKANIEGTGTTGTSATTNGGTQQVKQPATTKNDNIPYKQIGTTTKEITLRPDEFKAKTKTLNGVKYYVSGNNLYPISYAKERKRSNGYVYEMYFPEGTPYYDKNKLADNVKRFGASGKLTKELVIGSYASAIKKVEKIDGVEYYNNNNTYLLWSSRKTRKKADNKTSESYFPKDTTTYKYGIYYT